MADPLQEALRVIKTALTKKGIGVERVFLFGSRARGEAGPDSDFDFYVLIDRDLDFPQRHEIITGIKRQLAKFHVPNDIVLRSASRFEEIKDFPGHLAHDVAREGVLVS